MYLKIFELGTVRLRISIFDTDQCPYTGPSGKPRKRTLFQQSKFLQVFTMQPHEINRMKLAHMGASSIAEKIAVYYIWPFTLILNKRIWQVFVSHLSHDNLTARRSSSWVSLRLKLCWHLQTILVLPTTRLPKQLSPQSSEWSPKCLYCRWMDIDTNKHVNKHARAWECGNKMSSLYTYISLYICIVPSLQVKECVEQMHNIS